MSEHTPGPWHTGDGTMGRRIVYDARGMAIADAKLFHGKRASGEDFANARLIAAAPDLLLALQMAMPALDSVRAQFPRHPSDDSIDVVAAARAAIRKATGE